MIEIDLRIKHHFFPDDLYAKEMHLPAGHFAVSHRHTYDHLGVLWAGAVTVEIDGVLAEYRAPAFIMVRAGAEHRIVAVEDTTWFCVHETNETDVEKIDHVLIEGD